PAAALLEVVRPAHRADAHHAVRQRDHPHPAVLEAVDADVAGVFAGAGLGAAEMAEDRRALVRGVAAPEAALAGKERVAAARVDHVARVHAVAAPAVVLHLDEAVALALRLDAHDLRALAGVDTGRARVLEQHAVEVLPPDLERV